MAGSRIKGITVEIGGDTTKLQTALKGVNAEIKNTQSQLKDVEKLLKPDPGNIKLLTQKQKLLSSAVSETKEKLATLKTAAEHEDFEAASALIEQRASEKGIKKGNAKYQQRYAFSGKIICSECGNTFRRRIHSSTYGKYAAWVCNTHLEDTSRCSMLYIRDDDLKLAFTTMINKLVYCHKLVLKPYLKALQENSGDASLLNIQQLEILLEQNTEQRETLHKLMGQGYIDQILYTQENNALLSQAGEYRDQIELLNRSQSLDATKVYETERLLHFCEHGEMQLEYSEELFELFVDHIEVYSRQKIGFALHCGLILKEMI